MMAGAVSTGAASVSNVASVAANAASAGTSMLANDLDSTSIIESAQRFGEVAGRCMESAAEVAGTVAPVLWLVSAVLRQVNQAVCNRSDCKVVLAR